ncbi:MGMT family protein, partial [Alkalilimnicola sp. S0819]|uniref:MGMT family protein n=1 Tax=Alkalilimnicola sp. S0819 TaxID=2613922 RepID=UPI001261A229
MNTNFYEQVYEVARLIPKGRVTSFGAIAKSLGAAKSSRMVGTAMSVSHLAHPAVPAHRVVNHSGLLTGRFHFNPPELMEELLLKEDVKVADNKVVDFKTLFWNPMEE